MKTLKTRKGPFASGGVLGFLQACYGQFCAPLLRCKSLKYCTSVRKSQSGQALCSPRSWQFGCGPTYRPLAMEGSWREGPRDGDQASQVFGGDCLCFCVSITSTGIIHCKLFKQRHKSKMVLSCYLNFHTRKSLDSQETKL